MVGQIKETKELPIQTSANTSDRIVFVSNAASANSNSSVTASITIDNLFANTANLNATFSQLKIVSSLGSPVNSVATTVPPGVLWTDGTYVYFSSSNNHVKRIAGLDF